MSENHDEIWAFLRDKLDIHSRNALYIEAFTQRHDDVGKNNQRLAFLGDRVISMAIRQYYFRKDPEGGKGDLTKDSVEKEKEETLAGISEKLGIPEMMIGPNIPGGRRPPAEALEALFGAIYLDQGFEKARALVEKYILGDW